MESKIKMVEAEKNLLDQKFVIIHAVFIQKMLFITGITLPLIIIWNGVLFLFLFKPMCKIMGTCCWTWAVNGRNVCFNSGLQIFMYFLLNRVLRHENVEFNNNQK